MHILVTTTDKDENERNNNSFQQLNGALKWDNFNDETTPLTTNTTRQDILKVTSGFDNNISQLIQHMEYFRRRLFIIFLDFLEIRKITPNPNILVAPNTKMDNNRDY